MFVSFHLPVVDLRVLVTTPLGRRWRPLWPFGHVDPDNGRSEFLPGFGALRTTSPDLSGSWEGRLQHVRAEHALLFPDSLSAYLNKRIDARSWDTRQAGDLHVTANGRRFFGSATSPRGFLEISLEVADAEPVLTWPQVQAVVGLLTAMPMRLSGTKGTKPLARVGSDLADYVRRSTTKGSYTERVPSWMVVGGSLQCVVSLARMPQGRPPAAALTPSPSSDATGLWYLQQPDYEVWFVVEPEISRRKTIELHFSRMHSERAAFAAILAGLIRCDGLPNPPLSANSKKLQDALGSCTEYLTRQAAYGQDQAALMDVLDWDLDVHRGQWDALKRHIDQLPKPTQLRVERLVSNYFDLQGSQAVQIGNSNEMATHFTSPPVPHPPAGG